MYPKNPFNSAGPSRQALPQRPAPFAANGTARSAFPVFACLAFCSASLLTAAARTEAPLATASASALASSEIPARAPQSSATRQADEDRQVQNLAALARVFGIVRFFYPGDRAAAADWDRVCLLGAEAVRDAADTSALRDALLSVFGPLAPQLRIDLAQADGDSPRNDAAAKPKGEKSGDPKGVDASIHAPAQAAWATVSTKGVRLTFWQYRGINLSKKPSVYSQRRVILGDTSKDRAPLFPAAIAPLPLTQAVAPGLTLHMPLSLPVDEAGNTPEGSNEALAALNERLGKISLQELPPIDWRLHAARIVKVWCTFQHFHPYLDLAGVRWEEALEPALRRSLRARTVFEQHDALSALVAGTRDGHGYVYGAPAGRGCLPIRATVAEGRVVVTGVADGAPFRKGDIIESVDGVTALELLAEQERCAPGSPHLSRFRALNQFGLGPRGSAASVDIVREGRNETVEAQRLIDGRQYFFNTIGEFDHPAFAELRPGILYINLHELDSEGLKKRLPQLAAARGVIFDWRLGGRTPGKQPVKGLSPHLDLFPHLIDHPIQASPMRTPLIQHPNRAGWTYKESTWPVNPREPRLRGRIVFINEPSVVSYGETCMAMLAHYRLATLVGAPTAGCNGNATYLPLPGGGEVMWTAMDVRRHDGSSFYGAGFAPDHPVERTVRGIREGCDEFLEKAIAVIEGGGK